MDDALKPRDAKDVEEAVRWAVAEGKSLELVGHGSKRAIGRPAQTDVTLDLSRLAGITLYEPEELVLTAQAGTPLAEIEAAVMSRGQQLAFEPMNYAELLGGVVSRGTIGGTIATNLSGPRRPKAGAARDHFLGFKAVSGRGESFKSGGRVVKNVTGYDLCKLMAGSWGTLAAFTEVTIKTLPWPETEATVAVLGLGDDAAIAAMTAAMGSPCDVSGAAHLPVSAAAGMPLGDALADGQAVTLLRLEGFAPSVAHRRAVLTELVRRSGKPVVIEAALSQQLWRGIRDVTPFAASRTGADMLLWRISTPPAMGGELVRTIAVRLTCDVLYDWAGGLVWALIRGASDDAGVAVVRDAVAACGGHATLVRASPSLRAALPVFQPADQSLAALTKRVKAGFDPKGILNPGRMWAGV